MLSLDQVYGRSAAHRIIILAASLLLVSCSRQSHSDEPPLARVGDLTLNREDLQEESRLNYFSPGESAERWIDDQVLLYHASQSGVVDQSELSARLEEYKQRVIAGTLIDSLLQYHIHIDPELIREFYANNISSYQFQDSAALVVHMGFPNLSSAEEAHKALQSYPDSRDSLFSLYNFDRRIVYLHRIIPVLDEAIFSAEIDRFYGPHVSYFGYHLFLVERFYNPGDTIPFALVRKHIYERLFQEQLPLARSTIIDSLREELAIEIYPN